MKSSPKVAIILPVFNTEKYLKECLDSIINQDYENIIIYAIDDGSTDNSLNILNYYSNKNPAIHVLHQKNSGVSAARNLALNSIEHDESIKYVSFVDSDDIISKDFVSTFVKELTSKNADYGVCGVISFDKINRSDDHLKYKETMELRDSDIFEQYFSLGKWKNQGSTSHIFIANRFYSSSIVKHLRFNPNLKVGEDVDFIINFLRKAQTGVYIPQCNYFYRLRASSLSKADISPLENMLNLENDLKKSPENLYLKNYIKKSILDAWWGTLKHAYTTNNAEEKITCKNKFSTIRKINARIYGSKYARRLLIYRLGDSFINLYFKMGKNKNNNKKIFYFE
jgi:glycosyltransferase involved in cell wall biosynthesis